MAQVKKSQTEDGVKGDLRNLPFAFREYSPEKLKEALHKMYLIRRFEEGFHVRFIVAAPNAGILDLNTESAHDSQCQIREIL